MMTMNHHPLHTNAWCAEHETVQGKNVVVGNLVYSLALGMSVPDVSGSCIANLEVESLLHRSPTFHGDTIYAETRVLDATPSKSKDDRGIVTVETKAFNQHGEEVCYFRRKLMVWKTAAAPGATIPLRRRCLGLIPRSSRPTGSGASAAACWSGERSTAATCLGAARETPGPFWSPRSCCSRRRSTASSRITSASSLPFPPQAASAAAAPAAVVGLLVRTGLRRATRLNLHRTALAVVADHAGLVPRHDAALRALPGVGPYTARAVRTFRSATTWPRSTRMASASWLAPWRAPPSRCAQAMALGDRLVPAGESWEFNQAMFDLGATVCTAARPDCSQCPLRRQCAWQEPG